MYTIVIVCHQMGLSKDVLCRSPNHRVWYIYTSTSFPLSFCVSIMNSFCITISTRHGIFCAISILFSHESRPLVYYDSRCFSASLSQYSLFFLLFISHDLY